MTLAKYSLMAAALMALSACGKNEAPAKAASAGHVATEASATVTAPPRSNSNTIRIGHAAPLTGSIAHLGKDNENGARMAIDELNAVGGVEIGGKKFIFELVTQDDQADPKIASAIAQRFVDQKVVGVIGHLNSGTSIPASKIYSDAGIPEISPSATAVAYTAQGYGTVFRVIANDAEQGADLGKYAVNNLKLKKIAIVDDRTAYGKGLAEEFEKAAKAAGAVIVKHEYTTDRETNFGAALAEIKDAQPDLIFFGGMDAQAAPMTKQARKLGIKAQVMGADGTQTPEFIKLAGAEAEGTIASIPGLPKEQLPGGQDFLDRFKKKYGTDVQLYAPNCYDAVMVMVEAMKKAGSTDPAKYRPELLKIEYPGISGMISFDKKGDVKNGSITLYQVKGGKWEVLTTMRRPMQDI